MKSSAVALHAILWAFLAGSAAASQCSGTPACPTNNGWPGVWNNEVEDSLWKPFAAGLDCSKLSEEDCKKESFYSAKSAACALLRYDAQLGFQGCIFSSSDMRGANGIYRTPYATCSGSVPSVFCLAQVEELKCRAAGCAWDPTAEPATAEEIAEIKETAMAASSAAGSSNAVAIGVGVGVGLLVLVAIIAAAIFFFRRSKAAAAQPPSGPLENKETVPPAFTIDIAATSPDAVAQIPSPSQ